MDRRLKRLALLTVTAVGIYGATAPFWTLPARYLPPHVRAGGIAAVTTAGGIGAFISPSIIGFVTERTGSLAFAGIYYGALALAGAVLLLCAIRERA